MSGHVVTITGPRDKHQSMRFRAECSCGWQAEVPAVVTAAVVWNQHAKEAT